jgi:hypothetical protein
MPSAYPSLPEANDTTEDKAIRASCLQLANDIELAGAKIRVRANDLEVKGVPRGAGFTNLADRLNIIVGKLRRLAVSYPGPIPRPLGFYARELHEHAHNLREASYSHEAGVVGDFSGRLGKLDADWPDLDAEYFSLERSDPPLEEDAMLIEALRRHWINRAAWAAECAAPE